MPSHRRAQGRSSVVPVAVLSYTVAITCEGIKPIRLPGSPLEDIICTAPCCRVAVGKHLPYLAPRIGPLPDVLGGSSRGWRAAIGQDEIGNLFVSEAGLVPGSKQLFFAAHR